MKATTGSSKPFRIFLLDDHEVVRRGVAQVLDAEPGLVVVGEAGTCRAALRRVLALRPDLVVLDVRLPDGSGIDLYRQVRSMRPDTKGLVLTAYNDDQAILGAVLAGAAGYVLKDLGAHQLVQTVRAVAAGLTLLNPQAVKRVQSSLQREAADPRIGSLGMRERQVLALIGEGLTNKQIGARLGLAEKTIKNYVSGLLEKLGLERRTQVAILDAELRIKLASSPHSET